MTEQTEVPRRRPWGRRVLLGAAVLWALVLTAVVVVRGGPDDPAPAAAPSPSPSPSGPLTVAQVYQAVVPSVVLIQATGGSSDVDHSGRARSGTALGTGVIANGDGTVLTAFHVVEGASKITLTFADGTRSAATVGAGSKAMDIATLVPETLPDPTVPATLGGGPAVGDQVVAIGNPLGLADTTTSGVVSGLNRNVPRAGAAPLRGLIQFDAAVNPGSSGGPLINDGGQVIGIVVALVNPTNAGTFIGVGFAVPIGAAVGAGEGDGRVPPL
ncbi:S1C family serine protease [Cryptosporangium phraense]|uniref:Trypsin-like serine protease n=1 Tax=Cryptosporangium phraense TaxID=2593070 RepID=A0A545AU27_9ACTN|nr:trypsin-like peptidase domain-containing protein [Cryptosporangium phraense]TQS44771.1 trypsin-like serine protease [Cryptosporangium phraense]